MKKIIVALMLGVGCLWANNALVVAEEDAKNVEKCQANDAEACFKVKNFEKACGLGLAKACMEYRHIFSNENALLGIPYLKKACELGDMDGCKEALRRMIDWKTYWWWYRGRFEIYSNERYMQSLEEARVFLRKLCLDDGIMSICGKAIATRTNIDHKGEVGLVKETSLLSHNEYDNFRQKFIELYKLSLQERAKNCDEGDAESCVFVGVKYLLGYDTYSSYNGFDSVQIETEKDIVKAREFFQKACDAGDAKTCKEYQLTQDVSKFKAILEKGCSSGDQNACPRLGELYYEEGKSVGKDTAKAKELYQKSCDLNSADGCYKMAVYYNIGYGVSQDINKAKELYKKACDLKNNSACDNFKRLSK